MYNIVKIGGKDVPMLSMASVDIYYRNVFHEDPLTVQTNATDPGEAIMAEFAERKTKEKMRELREDDFLDWLDGFDRLDLMTALGDIQKTSDGQAVSNTDAKKNNDELSVA